MEEKKTLPEEEIPLICFPFPYLSFHYLSCAWLHDFKYSYFFSGLGGCCRLRVIFNRPFYDFSRGPDPRLQLTFDENNHLVNLPVGVS